MGLFANRSEAAEAQVKVDLRRLVDRFKNLPEGYWEVAGPHPDISIVTCSDPGSTHPEDAEPPSYDLVLSIDERTDGPVNETALALARFIVEAQHFAGRVAAAMDDPERAKALEAALDSIAFADRVEGGP